MIRSLAFALLVLVAVTARGQIQVDLKFNSRLLRHADYTQTRSSPRLRAADGTVAVAGGTADTPLAPAAQGKTVPKLSDRPLNLPPED